MGRPRRVGCVRAPVSRPPRVPHPRKVQGRDLHPFQGRRRRLIVGTREGPRVRRVRLHVPGGALPQVFGSDTAPRGRRGPRQRRGQGALRRRVSAPGHCEMRRGGKTSRAARARVRGQGSVRRGAGAGAERHSFAESGAAPRGLSSRRGVEGRRRRVGQQRHLPRRALRRDGGEGGGSFGCRGARRHPEAGVSRLRARGRVLGAARGDGTAAELGYVHGLRAPEDAKLARPHRHRGLAKLRPGERARRRRAMRPCKL
mmetsp:Transcript_1679/g.6537  ORF Transcript_1679/g.6537 Transcript_1679/m.6537 type:complete len:257 (-) Transcript_1679:515-1285(-)